MMNAPLTVLSLRRRLIAESGSLALLALYFVIFFYRGITGREFFLFMDPYSYLYPLRMIAWQQLRNGELPLWIPQIFSGYPLFSMSQIGLAYPLTWLYLILPGQIVEQFLVIAPNLLSSVFTYLYLRELHRSREAALLGGLTFAYSGMMASWISNGLMNNTVMWLPLILIGLHRTSTKSLSYCLWRTVAAYLLSVLTGVGQGFVYVGIVMLAYGLFLSLTGHCLESQKSGIAAGSRKWFIWRRWKPLALAILTILFAAGLASFQLFESWQAKQLSIRQQLSYELFSQLSYPPWMLLSSLIAPLFNCLETTPYVLPVSLLLTLAAVVQMIRQPRPHALLWFWLVVGLIALTLMTGPATPLHRLLYHVPIIRDFRGPSRHSLEWTFAVSIVAAFGWDSLARFIGSRKARLSVENPAGRRERLSLLVASVSIVTGVVLSFFWYRAIPLPDQPDYFKAWTPYLLYKISFVVLMLVGIWMALRLRASARRQLLLTGLLLLSCFTDPYLFSRRWWIWVGIPPARFSATSTATQFIHQQPQPQSVPERTYTRANVASEQFSLTPALDNGNNTALHGLYDVAGYEPLILHRYSQALGNVWLDGFTPRAEPVSPSLWDEKSQVLDLLNTRYVIGYHGMAINPPAKGDSAKFGSELPAALTQGNIIQLTASGEPGDRIGVVSTLANSVTVEEGTPVAKILIHTTDGRVIERMIRAGADTSEWAHDRPDVRAVIRHRRAKIFNSIPGDGKNSFAAHTYQTLIPLDERARIGQVEIHRLNASFVFALWRAAILDSKTGISQSLVPLSQLEFLNFPNRWETALMANDVMILRNKRTLPRAWLVSSAMAVSETEALQHIRGQHPQPWHPRETALLEIPPTQLPPLPGGPLKDDARVEIIRHKASSLELQSTASQPTMLIVSEVNYPGWQATVDGQAAEIYQTNYLLRGIFLPPGAHRIEMRYTAPAARRGLIVSLLTLIALGTLLAVLHRQSHKHSVSLEEALHP